MPKQKSDENRDGGRLAAHFIKSYGLPSIEYTVKNEPPNLTDGLAVVLHFMCFRVEFSMLNIPTRVLCGFIFYLHFEVFLIISYCLSFTFVLCLL